MPDTTDPHASVARTNELAVVRGSVARTISGTPEASIRSSSCRRHLPHLRWPQGRRRRSPRDPARLHHRPDRPERCRQDDPVQSPHRVRPPGYRHVDAWTATHSARMAPHRVARHGMVRTFQLTKALSKTDGARQRPSRCHATRRVSGCSARCSRGRGTRRNARSPNAPTNCSPGSSSTPRPTISPGHCPADSANCSRWHAH